MMKKQSKKYFNDLGVSNKNNIQSDDLNSLREKLKLEFSIQNSKQFNYSINVKLFDEQNIDFISENKESHAEPVLNFEKFLSATIILKSNKIFRLLYIEIIFQ